MFDTALAIAPPSVDLANFKPLGVIRDYAQLAAGLRRVAEMRAISRETIDAISGVQPGYSSKVLAPIPTKALGYISMGPLLGSLGLALVLVEDPLQLERVADRYTKRNAKAAHSRRRDLHAMVNYRIAVLRSIAGRKGRRLQLANSTPEMLSRVARKAARTRRANTKRRPVK
jgi:hypothetical protein